LEYLIRVDRVSRELILFFSEVEEPRWREAARKLFDSTQEARGEALRLEEAAPEWIVACFERWGCKLPEELRAPRTRVRRR
jgi:hypothetical protein